MNYYCVETVVMAELKECQLLKVISFKYVNKGALGASATSLLYVIVDLLIVDVDLLIFAYKMSGVAKFKQAYQNLLKQLHFCQL